MCPELQDVAPQDAQQEAAAPNSEINLFSNISLLRGTIAGFYATETSGGTCKHNQPLHTLGIILWTAPVLFCPFLLSSLLNPKKTQLSFLYLLTKYWYKNTSSSAANTQTRNYTLKTKWEQFDFLHRLRSAKGSLRSDWIRLLFACHIHQ